MASPNFAEELAADTLTARFLVGHDSAARAEDGHAHPRDDTRDPVVPHVDAAAGGRDAANAIDGARTVAPVAQDEHECLGAFVGLGDAHVVNEPLSLEHG